MRQYFYVNNLNGPTVNLGTFPSFNSAEKALYQFAHEKSAGESESSFYELVDSLEVTELDPMIAEAILT